MMKLTDEMIQETIRNNQKFNIYDDKCVLLYKKFPVKNTEIDKYIKTLESLKEKGVNTPLILDYHIVETSEFGYCKAVILEEKADGTTLDLNPIYINLKNESIDFKKVSDSYLSALDSYINEIENRANVSQNMYDKFLTDFFLINNSNLQIDPKPLNFYFSSSSGFTFIDINGVGENGLNYLPMYFLGAVLGYGVPNLKIHSTNCMYIDNDRLKRLTNGYQTIISKVLVALEKYGYSRKYILKDTPNWLNQLNRLNLVESLDDLDIKLENDFIRIKKEEEAKKVEADDDWGFKL